MYIIDLFYLKIIYKLNSIDFLLYILFIKNDINYCNYEKLTFLALYMYVGLCINNSIAVIKSDKNTVFRHSIKI